MKKQMKRTKEKFERYPVKRFPNNDKPFKNNTTTKLTQTWGLVKEI